MEEAWEHYLRAERKELRLRREGLLARLLGAPLPDESVAELALVAEEDRLRAEAGLVELRDADRGTFYKHLEDLRREDRLARAGAERARTAWLKERNERRARGLDFLSGDRVRFEEERGRLLAAELLEGARTEERKSVGRELHDRVSHTMGVAHQSLQLYEALRARDPQGAQAKLELAKRMVLEAMDQTRDLSLSLRQLEAEGGIEPALSELLEETLSPDTSHELEVEGEESLLPARVRDQLFLILREAVRNTIAHSGTSAVGVTLRINDKEANAIVEDRGKGFDLEKAMRDGSGGLRYMQERAELVGGRVRVKSAPEEGTRVEVVVPLPQGDRRVR